MYRFILGGSGSGKSNKVFTDCIAAAMADGSSHFLLVTPEQSTAWAEKEIIRLHPHHAADNIDVVSFSRLAYRVFGELEIVNPRVINDIEKAMVLRRIGHDHREELSIWGSGFGRPGFVDNLKSMISELYQYGLTPEDIKTDESFGNVLNKKLHDLKLIYAAFKNEIADKFTTAEEIPDILARNIHRSGLIKKSVIILDGFTGFTPIQYKIIEGFLCYAKEVVITVSIGSDSENSLFDMSRDMIRHIAEIGDKNSISRGKDTVLSSDSFIENHILRYDGAVCKDRNAPRIVRACNMQEETEFICSCIEKLVREEGLRYRDMAVICSDQEAYGHMLSHQMALSGIPSYMDETIGISNNALVTMLTAALDVMRTDYSYESFIRYLKSGLVTENEDAVFILDNYIYECGRRGYKRMSAEWVHIPADLKGVGKARINKYKNEAMESLKRLHGVFEKKKAPVSGIVDALFDLMDQCAVEEKLEALRDDFALNKDRYREREYAKAYESVSGILEDMKELLRDEEMGPDEFAEIFTAGINEIKLGVIPSGVDRVVIGDVTRSRIEGVKILFVAGANEGLLPKLLNRKNVITDTEKERLKAAGYELAPTAREDLLIQRYYIYRIFSKPTQQLIVSYSGLDQKGSAIRPSYIAVHLKKLFPDIVEEKAVDNISVFNMNSAVSLMGSRLRQLRISGTEDFNGDIKGLSIDNAPGSENLEIKNLKVADLKVADSKVADSKVADSKTAFEQLYAYLRQKDAARTALITKAALFNYKPHKLSQESVDLLYGNILEGSVSKLETFVGCPYRFFAKYGLGLKEIEEFSFRAVDIGNIAHGALEKIYVRARDEKTDLRALEEDERRRLVRAAVKDTIDEDGSSKYTDSAHNEYIIKRVERVVQRSLWGLLNDETDNMRPYEMEWSFTPGDKLAAAIIKLDGGRSMELSGKIDRTDIDDSDPEKIGVRIIDYKSGSRTWDLDDIINGNDLQLTMYMAAVKELLADRFKDAVISPEQMYYYKVQDPIIDMDALGSKKTVEEELRKQMAPAGIEEREKIEMLIPFVRGKAEGIGRSITGGDISVSPKQKDNKLISCSYCEYSLMCGFDRKIEGYKARTDKKYPKDEQWQIISGQMNS